jgi:N-formylglutamate amidohydrolase
MKPLLITIPHSGELVPTEASWLQNLPETLLMCDVDRYVDRLYEPLLTEFKIPFVLTPWHRYAIDLNRLPDDVDVDSVLGHKNPSGKFARGLHWRITTTGEKLMPKPISQELHQDLVQKYFEPFHQQVRSAIAELRKRGANPLYHIDAHSMPSLGTTEHRDPGELRADIVVSDCNGTSCSAEFKDWVVEAYQAAGFKVAYNWPYTGGRVTETYGKPREGCHSVQVELNRALYMNEQTKQLRPELVESVQKSLKKAVEKVLMQLPEI